MARPCPVRTSRSSEHGTKVVRKRGVVNAGRRNGCDGKERDLLMMSETGQRSMIPSGMQPALTQRGSKGGRGQQLGCDYSSPRSLLLSRHRIAHSESLIKSQGGKNQPTCAPLSLLVKFSHKHGTRAARIFGLVHWPLPIIVGGQEIPPPRPAFSSPHCQPNDR